MMEDECRVLMKLSYVLIVFRVQPITHTMWRRYLDKEEENGKFTLRSKQI